MMVQLQQPQVSVVICTRNRSAFLYDAIESVLHQEFDPEAYEIIVIDDGSTDDTAERVKKLENNNANLIRVSRGHSGLNASRNAGIHTSKADIVLFMDDDEIAPPEFLEKVVALLESHPEINGVGGSYKDYGDASFKACGRCEWIAITLNNNCPGETDRLLGGNMAIRKSTFQQIGYFNEKLSGRGDELEWFHRAKNKARFYFDPDLWLWHRRDNFRISKICLDAYRQGKSFPEYRKQIGKPYKPRPRHAIRQLTHAVSKSCIKGLVQFFRELGAMEAYVAKGYWMERRINTIEDHI